MKRFLIIVLMCSLGSISVAQTKSLDTFLARVEKYHKKTIEWEKRLSSWKKEHCINKNEINSKTEKGIAEFISDSIVNNINAKIRANKTLKSSNVLNAESTDIVNIPDPIFKNVLVNESDSIDANHDGEIQYSEAEAVIELYISGYDIQDIAGIEAFTSLRALDFIGNEISGPFPEVLFGLTNLEHLRISSNNLSGPLPSEIGGFTNLKYLNLFNNDLDGGLPVQLFSLEHLIHLDLSFNNLSGSIPTTIENLTKLEVLSLSSNNLDGGLPSQLFSLVHLTSLWLYSNNFSGTIPNTIGNLANLEYLQLRDNDLNGDIPSELYSLYNLTYLGLSGNDISGIIASDIGGLVNLKYLHLSNHSGNIPEELWTLTKLDDLSITGEDMTGEISANIGNLATIDKLNLSGSFTGEIPEVLGALFTLDELILGGIFTGSIPSSIGNLNNLEVLRIDGCSGIIPASIGNLISLKELDLQGNFSGQIPKEIGNLDNLETLFLVGDYTNNLRAFQGSIPTELGNLSSLKELFISDTNLRGTIPESFNNLSNCEFIALPGNKLDAQLTDLSSAPKLSFLDVESNKLTFEDLIDIEKTYYIRYNPQDTLFQLIHDDVLDSLVIVDDSCPGNKYKWFLNGKVLPDTTISVSCEDVGIYWAEVSNPQSPDLIIYTDTIDFRQPIDTLKAPFLEDFGQLPLAPLSWINGNCDEEWSFSNLTPTSLTGPDADHTGLDGYFAYTEANMNYDKEFCLTTPIINLSSLNAPSLNFWYHLYGEHMGTLQIDIYNTKTTTWYDNIFSVSGDQGNEWVNTIVHIDTSLYSPYIKIKFKGITGSGHRSDIAIDDIAISDDQGDEVPTNTQVSYTILTSGSTDCFNATNTITIAGDGAQVIVESGASANFIAGQSIRFLPGFHAHEGSYVNGRITETGEYCMEIVPAIVAQQQEEQGKQDEEKAAVVVAGLQTTIEGPQTMLVYPNPNSGLFTIKFSHITEETQVMLFNSIGQLIYTKTTTNPEILIDIPNITSGMYIVKAINRNNQFDQKIIVY